MIHLKGVTTLQLPILEYVPQLQNANYRLFGIPISSKSFTYLLAAQLLFNRVSGWLYLMDNIVDQYGLAL